MLRLFFYVIASMMLAVGVYGVISNWKKDQGRVDEALLVSIVAVMGMLVTWAI